jgi:hypothetical protein
MLLFCLKTLLWLLLLQGTLTIQANNDNAEYFKQLNDNMMRQNTFSGVYLPNLEFTAEHYAGAWLTTKARFLNTLPFLRKIDGLESASFAILHQGTNAMTRDYFDFQLLHLSSTTNQLPTFTKSRLNDELRHRMAETVKLLRTTNTSINRRNKDKRLLRQTVVLIPFSTRPASQRFPKTEVKAIKLINDLRIQYIRATVYSIHRYFPKIIVATGTNADLELVQSLRLPISSYINLTGVVEDTSSGMYFLPKQALLFLHEKLSQSDLLSEEAKYWRNIRYIYYTEADHILYARHLSALYNILDKFNATLSIIPHRMQVLFSLVLVVVPLI